MLRSGNEVQSGVNPFIERSETLEKMGAERPEVLVYLKRMYLPFNTGAANISVAHGGLAVRFVDRNIGLQVQSSQSERNVKMGTIRSGKKTINIFTRK